MEEASYYRVAVLKHPDIKDEWVASVLANPYHIEAQTDGRLRCYGYVEEAGKWLRVVVEDGKLFNRFFDRAKMKEWGKP